MKFDAKCVSIEWAGGGCSHDYLIPKSNLKTVWVAHKSEGRCENYPCCVLK